MRSGNWDYVLVLLDYEDRVSHVLPPKLRSPQFEVAFFSRYRCNFSDASTVGVTDGDTS
jgi:hypothetical protein